MRSALKSTWTVAFAVMFAGCLLPEYSVDENLGSAGAGGGLPELPPPPANCGNTTGGPTMVPLRGGYCIDSTEVTWRQYVQWAGAMMLTPAELAKQPPECSWNLALMPPPTMGCEEPLGTDADMRPVVCVDWCDARLYCESVGKELCGEIDGEDLVAQDYADPARSQWTNACTAGGRNDYPYAGAFDPSACHTLGTSQGQPIPVQTKPNCASKDPGYAGTFDLSGNVAEWEDSCTAKVGQGDKCRARGGSFKEANEGATCRADRVLNRESTVDYVGFRCCWAPSN